MNLDANTLVRLSTLATRAARRAGALIATTRPQTVEHKVGGLSLAAQVVTEVDRAAEALIVETLAEADDDIAVLTEEQPDDGARFRHPYFWCVDPLDGTLPFVEGKPGFSVSIALVSSSGVPQLGVVFVPTDDVLFRAVRGGGVWRNDAPFTVSAKSKVFSIFADRSLNANELRPRLDAIAGALSLDRVEVHKGAGAVVNACRVLEHAPACYFKQPKLEDGGGSIWDFAATACIFHEAGAVATDIFGAPLDLNRADSTFMNHNGVLFASDATIGKAIRTLAPEPAPKEN